MDKVILLSLCAFIAIIIMIANYYCCIESISGINKSWMNA